MFTVTTPSKVSGDLSLQNNTVVTPIGHSKYLLKTVISIPTKTSNSTYARHKGNDEPIFLVRFGIFPPNSGYIRCMLNSHSNETHVLIWADKLYGFSRGTNISCKALALNSQFDSWSGADIVSKNNASLSVSGNRLLIANFDSGRSGIQFPSDLDPSTSLIIGNIVFPVLAGIGFWLWAKQRRRLKKYERKIASALDSYKRDGDKKKLKDELVNIRLEILELFASRKMDKYSFYRLNNGISINLDENSKLEFYKHDLIKEDKEDS
jgi:hypothetical protein